MTDRYIRARHLMDVMDIRTVDRILTHMCIFQERKNRLRKQGAWRCLPVWCTRNTGMLDWNKRWQRMGDW